MLTSGSRRSRRGQWSLVGILVGVTIVIILAALYFPRIAARHSRADQAATPTERGYGAACSEYAAQMNQSVQMYKTDHDEKPPTSLDQLKSYGVTDEMLNAQGCSFQIDPATGTVSDTGAGRAQPGTAPTGAPPPPNAGTRGPGGVTIPNIPDAGSSM